MGIVYNVYTPDQKAALARIQADNKQAWDAFAAAAVSGITTRYTVNDHVYETTVRITEFAADIADKLMEERKKRYGPVES